MDYFNGYVLTHDYVTENFSKKTRFFCTNCDWNNVRGETYLIMKPHDVYQICVCPKCKSRLHNPKDDRVDYCGLS
jgi:hypothetical protein